ncbi:MAG: hypothetical protein GY811_25820 [Myxococcales bacterium]|nr:hypothetical protein [Myxococcales bacterium]
MTLYASVGTISDPVSSHGRLTATYTPPTTRFPQVAIIAAATSDRSQVDFITIALIGQPTIRIASEPRAVVHVGVGDEKFGPLELNRKGLGTIQVIVPPGVDSATIYSADHLGNESQEPHELGIPPFQQLLALCPEGGETFLVIATDARGRALRNANVELEAEFGMLSAIRMKTPGVYLANFTVADDATSVGDVLLTASLPSAGPASTVHCRAQVPREDPSGLEITTARDRFLAGSDAPVEVLIKLAYAGKSPPRGARPILSVDTGELSRLKQVSPSLYWVQWTLPNHFAGRSQAKFHAVLEDLGVRGDSTLMLVAAPIARVAMSGDGSRLVANPDRSASIVIAAFDDFENPVATDTVHLTASAGRVGPPQTQAHRTTARYRPPLRHSPSQDTITARAESGAQASISLQLDPMPRPLLTNARLGYATNFGTISTMAFAVDAMYRLPIGSRAMAIGLESGYLSSSERRMGEDGLEEFDLELAAVPLVARVLFDLGTVPGPIYAGGGVGMLFARASIASGRTGMRSENATSLALSGFVGARRRLGRGHIVFEAAYWHCRFDEEGLAGNIGGLRITGGYGFDL